MEKKIIKCIVFAFILMIGILNINHSSFAATDEYIINNYDIDMIVNEDNSFDITEKIQVYFNVSKHGIKRKIPIKNTIKRLDDSTSKNRAKISNIKVNDKYTVSTENDQKVLKIGDADTTVRGYKEYIISYHYDIGKDPLKNADELYFNLIGPSWDTTINNVDFTITMPKQFDVNKLGFSSGSYGTSTNNVSYEVIGNTIKGYTTFSLKANEALTIRLTLPEGYFVYKFKPNYYAIFTIILCVIFTLTSAKLWKKYGKDDEVIETVEFYPPEGYNSAEVEFLYNGSVTNKGIISLLIYLADKGYIKIIDTSKTDDNTIKSLFTSKENFRIVKLKEYDGDNEVEQMFMQGLFKNTSTVKLKDAEKYLDDSITNKESVGFSDLYDKFYKTINSISSKMNSRKNKNKIFEKVASSKGIYLIFMCIIIFSLISIKPILEYGESEMIPMIFGFLIIGFPIAETFLFGKTPLITKIFVFIWSLGFVGTPIIILLTCWMEEPIYVISGLIGLISIIIITIFVKIMPKRTPFGTEMLGKISGFKHFLETAEKERLEALVEENPEYFYNVLPYTYALNVSSKWMKKFETIAMKEPDWYYSYNGFEIHAFNNFMTSTMANTSTAMTSAPSQSSGGSGGGFSGGGFSGGGSGGGRRLFMVINNKQKYYFV